jgi:hypothetical protein
LGALGGSEITTPALLVITVVVAIVDVTEVASASARAGGAPSWRSQAEWDKNSKVRSWRLFL